ncbi:IpaD/SipD/SspD family type III secretion system needle tip protein [Enterobacter ludwigii]|uniref:IpaD/SipD/SspD family type III secretion system needle tip protein n=1 Tax=Enterobacter ludwigii TaxID=299767 RepID=UPI003976DE60
MDLNERRDYDVASGIPEQFKTFPSRGHIKTTETKTDSTLIDVELERSTDTKQYFFNTTSAFLSRMSDMARASRNTAMEVYKSAAANERTLCDLQKSNFRELSADLKLQSNSCFNFIRSFDRDLTYQLKDTSSYPNLTGSLENVFSALPAALSDVPQTSDREICELIAELMHTLHDDYLEIFEHSVEKQTAYWQKFTDFQSQLAKNTTTSGGDSRVTISGIESLWSQLEKLMVTYEPVDVTTVSADFILYPVEPDTYVSKAEAKKWAQELGLPDGCVYGSGDKYIVVIDTTPANRLRYSNVINCGLPSWAGSTTEYQAWQTTYNAQAENIKTNTQTLTTKYSTANSTYDTIIKLLSSSIQTLFDCCKEALRF